MYFHPSFGSHNRCLVYTFLFLLLDVYAITQPRNHFLNIAGLHVLSSESVQIPWFDSVLADIGDEQSLSQSLSTFFGHLKQISVSKTLFSETSAY